MRRSLLVRSSFCLLVLGLAACPKEETLEPLALEPGCNPLLAGADCFLPYPSDHFRVPDASMPTGFRVEPQGAAKLKTTKGRSADPSDFRAVDGASRLPVIVAMLPGRVSAEGLSDIFADPEGTLGDASPTVLMEAETGRRIAHFVDLDARADDPERRAIILRPLVGLEANTRYIVALRRIRDDAGEPLPAPEGFRRLRDQQTLGDPVLHPLSEHYERAVFPALDQAGVARAELQLAWDFTTRSDEHAWRDMLRMRELTLSWLESNVPEVRVTEVRETHPGVWRSVRGELTVPLFLDSTGDGGRIFRGPDGQVAQNGTTKIPFVAVVPHAVRDAFEPGRAIAFGHGFFGTRYEIESPAYRTIGNELGAVLFSIDWWGMSATDLPMVSDAAVSRPSHIALFVERVHQGMANWLVMLAAIQGPLGELPELRRPVQDGEPGVVTNAQGQSNAGAVVFERQARYFVGHSNGHVLGGTLAALAPTVERFAFSVGGVGYSQMMFRSRNFMAFLDLLEIPLPGRLDQQKFAASLQPVFDFVDPASYSPLVRAPLPGMRPSRHILMQTGLGDPQVPNFASFIHARMLGLPLLEPAPFPIWGLDQKAPGEATSGLTVFDFGVDWQEVWRDNDPDNPPNVVHDGLRVTPSSMRQVDRFLRPDGQLIHPCEGVCDPE